MNLSPEWVAELSRYGYEAVHWSTVGAGDAADSAIMAWARANDHLVFTQECKSRVRVLPL
jgi:predicted nuclease of predicted toxin-antitoxin system